jgi:hypothetical protein
MKKTMKHIILGLFFVGIIIPVHGGSEYSRTRSSDNTKKRYNKHLAKQLGLTPTQCFLNKSSNCVAEWVGNIYTEVIKFEKVSSDDSTESTYSTVQYGKQADEQQTEVRNKKISKQKGVGFKEGQFVFELDNGNNLYRGFVLQDIIIWANTQEFALWGDEKSGLGIYVNHGLIQGEITVSERNHMVPYKVSINDIPSNLKIIASEDRTDISEIVLRWEIPVDVYGNILLPRGSSGLGGSGVSAELDRSYGYLEENFSDEDRLNFGALKLSLRRFVRKFNECESKTACSQTEAFAFLSHYELDIDEIQSKMSNSAMADFDYFVDVVNEVRQLFK